MTLNKQSWHYKVFSWFKEGDVEHSNLCPYVRTVFIWAPLRFLLGDGQIGRVYVAAITWPLLLASLPVALLVHGAKDGFKVVIAMYTMLSILAGSLLLAHWLESRDKKKLLSLMTEDERWRYEQNGAIPKRLKQRRLIYRLIKAAKHSLIWQFVKAAHDRVCPIIRFE